MALMTSIYARLIIDLHCERSVDGADMFGFHQVESHRDATVIIETQDETMIQRQGVVCSWWGVIMAPLTKHILAVCSDWLYKT